MLEFQNYSGDRSSSNNTNCLFGSVQSFSLVRLFVTPQTAARQASLSSFTISQSLLKLMSIESVLTSNCLILCCSLLLLLSIFPSIRVFSSESVLRIRWPKYWIFSFSFSPSDEYSGLISFRIDWFDFLAVQGTLKNLLQHHGVCESKDISFLVLYGPLSQFSCVGSIGKPGVEWTCGQERVHAHGRELSVLQMWSNAP